MDGDTASSRHDPDMKCKTQQLGRGCDGVCIKPTIRSYVLSDNCILQGIGLGIMRGWYKGRQADKETERGREGGGDGGRRGEREEERRSKRVRER